MLQIWTGSTACSTLRCKQQNAKISNNSKNKTAISTMYAIWQPGKFDSLNWIWKASICQTTLSARSYLDIFWLYLKKIGPWVLSSFGGFHEIRLISCTVWISWNLLDFTWNLVDFTWNPVNFMKSGSFHMKSGGFHGKSKFQNVKFLKHL